MKGQRGLRPPLAAALALALLAGPVLGQAVIKPAATVNGEPISVAEVDATVKQMPPAPTPLTETQSQELRRENLDFLINELVMKQFLQRALAGKLNLRPDSPEVNKQIAELAATLHQKKVTLAQFLHDTGQSEDQLRANAIKKLHWDAYVAQYVTDGSVKQYYEAYKPFFDKVTVKASHILIKLPPTAKDSDRQAVRTRLLALRQEIMAGKIEFADAARKYSECPSGKEGGDIGVFPRFGYLQEAFAQAAFDLKVGEISGVVETDYGMHLIKVTERSPGEPSDFGKIKDDVRRFYIGWMMNAIMVRERKAARIEINLP